MKYGAKMRIYPLAGYEPEVVAVAFGKCSRSPEPFDKIIKELDVKKSRRFHEKYILGFGHKSVAEHAVTSLALENVSILATKVIEDNRLASYTEKSTRYQKFDKDHYYKPRNVLDSSLGDLYKETCDFYFDAYDKMTENMFKFIRKKYPEAMGMDKKAYESKTRNRVFDNCRYMLPVATQTNLGMTVNARQLEHAINKMLSHPLEEIQKIGQELKKAARKVIPTLVRDTKENDYIINTNKTLMGLTSKLLKEKDVKDKPVVLVNYDRQAEEKIIAAILYKYSHLPYKEIRSQVKKMSVKNKKLVISEALKRMKGMDWPIRELEHVYYTFEIMIDYGAFRDIQRHRMCTQTNQLVTLEHGYSVPDEIVEAGYGKAYKDFMEIATSSYRKIAKRFPFEAQYIAPLASKKKTLFTWNLRELYHFIKLRSGQFGHISYRRIAQEVYRHLKKVHPLLAEYIMVNLD